MSDVVNVIVDLLGIAASVFNMLLVVAGAGLVGVLLGARLTEARQARDRKKLSGAVAELFRSEIEELTRYFVENGENALAISPSMPAYQGYTAQLPEVFPDDDRGALIIDFYRKLSSLEIARAELRETFREGSGAGPGMEVERSRRLEPVRERIDALERAGTDVVERLTFAGDGL